MRTSSCFSPRRLGTFITIFLQLVACAGPSENQQLELSVVSGAWKLNYSNDPDLPNIAYLDARIDFTKKEMSFALGAEVHRYAIASEPVGPSSFRLEVYGDAESPIPTREAVLEVIPKDNGRIRLEDAERNLFYEASPVVN